MSPVCDYGSSTSNSSHQRDHHRSLTTDNGPQTTDESIGLEFLHQYRGQRLRPDPDLLNFSSDEDSPLVDEEPVDPDLELPREKWKTLDSLQATGTEHLLPIRFVDGCHRGQTVALVRDGDGHSVPVMHAGSRRWTNAPVAM